MKALPAFTGRVVDNADLLSPDEERALTAKLEGLEDRTTDQLVVVTVPTLGDEKIESFGIKLGNGWGIGRSDVDNGVLLIVAAADHKVRIEVGCGLEGLLTDTRAAEILDTAVIPAFKQKDYAGGIDAGVDAIVETLETKGDRPIPRLSEAEQ